MRKNIVNEEQSQGLRMSECGYGPSVRVTLQQGHSYLRDTQEGWVDRIWTHKQTSAVVILRDQTEEHPLFQIQLNIPKQSSELMLELRWNQLNDMNSGQTIQPWVGQYNLGSDNTTLKRMNLTFTPPQRCSVPMCVDHSPEGTVSGGVHEVGQQAEGKFREVNGRYMLGGLGVPLVEFGYKHLCTLTSSDGLHFSSLILYPFQCMGYSSFPWKIRLSRMLSTSYSSTPSWTMGGGGLCCTLPVMVSVL